eukprot:658812-Alexandrium_andersonii.AAC.1
MQARLAKPLQNWPGLPEATPISSGGDGIRSPPDACGRSTKCLRREEHVCDARAAGASGIRPAPDIH